VTMATTLVSLMTDRPVRPLTAMTGEITLSGNVLPVGGIKEKFLAAKRAGVQDVILPAENRQSVEEDLTADQIENVRIHYAESFKRPANQRAFCSAAVKLQRNHGCLISRNSRRYPGFLLAVLTGSHVCGFL
jgi:ATP-dependent Lon protease